MGCGTGLLSFALQPFLGQITLADSSDGMLAVLRDKIAAQGVSKHDAGQARFVDRSVAGNPLRPDLYHDDVASYRRHGRDSPPILRVAIRPAGSASPILTPKTARFTPTKSSRITVSDRAAFGAKAARAGFQQIDFSTVFCMTKEILRTIKRIPGLLNDREAVVHQIINFYGYLVPPTSSYGVSSRGRRGRRRDGTPVKINDSM